MNNSSGKDTFVLIPDGTTTTTTTTTTSSTLVQPSSTSSTSSSSTTIIPSSSPSSSSSSSSILSPSPLPILHSPEPVSSSILSPFPSFLSSPSMAMTEQQELTSLSTASSSTSLSLCPPTPSNAPTTTIIETVVPSSSSTFSTSTPFPFPPPSSSSSSSSSFPFLLRISSVTGDLFPSADTVSRTDLLYLHSLPQQTTTTTNTLLHTPDSLIIPPTLPDSHYRTISNLLLTGTPILSTTISDTFDTSNTVDSSLQLLRFPPLSSPLIDDLPVLPVTDESSVITTNGTITVDNPITTSSSPTATTLTTPPPDDFPILGISLDGIHQFINQHGGFDAFLGKTTHDVCPLVKKLTIDKSYCSAHEGYPYIGNANIFVSHAWQYPFLYVVKVLGNWITQHQNHSSSSSSSFLRFPNVIRTDEYDTHESTLTRTSSYPVSPTWTMTTTTTTNDPSPSSPIAVASPSLLPHDRAPLIVDRATTYFWFDLFSNSQHTVTHRPFTWWRDCFRKNIGLLGHTLLILQWNNPIPLTRIWCAWELACTTDQKSYLEIGMDPVEETAFHEALVNNYDSLITKLCDINVEKAEATNMNDKNNIYTAIRRTIGFYETNKRITQQMRRWMINVGTIMLHKITDPLERGLSKLLVNVGRLYFDQGKYEQAEPLLTEAYQYRKDHYGYENEETLLAMTALGRLYHSQARYREGQEIFTLLLAYRNQLHGSQDRRTLVAMNFLASLYQGQGQLKAAEQLYAECLAIRRTILTDHDADTLTSMNNLGGVYILLGKYKEAKELYSEALRLRTETLGIDHPETLSSLNNFGLLYSAMNENKKKAEEYFLQALDGRKRVLGDNHPDTLSSLNNVAGYYMTQGKQENYAKAEKLYLRALQLRKWILGEDHIDTLSTKNNLGRVYQFMDRYRESETLLTQAYQGRKKYLPPYHQHTLASMNNLGNLYTSMGKHKEAEELFLETIAGRKIAFHSVNHPDVLATMNNLGNLYKLMGKYKESEDIYVNVLNERTARFGENNRATIASMNNLANVYKAIGRYESALDLYRKALNYRQQNLGKDHPDTLSTLHNIAACYRSQRQYDEAEKLCKEVVDLRTQTLGIDKQATLHSMTNLANVWYYQQRYTECEQMYREVLERTRKIVKNEHHTDILSLQTYLTAVYRCQGKYTESLGIGLPVFMYIDEIRRSSNRGNDGDSGDEDGVGGGEKERNVITEPVMGSLSLPLDHSQQHTKPHISVALPRLYDIAHELGIVYRYLGNTIESVRYLTLAYEGRLKVVGKDHTDTLNSLYSLSLTRGDQETVRLLEETHGIVSEV